jgi:hypothetical protein
MPRMPIQSFNKPVQSFRVIPTTTEVKLKLLAERLQQHIQTNKSQTFEEDYIVTKTLGAFKTGDSVKGLSYEQIFIKLLGLRLRGEESPDDPGVEPDKPNDPSTPVPELPETPTIDQIIDYIIAEQTTIHQVNASGELEEIPYKVKTYTETSYAQAPENVETTFYKVTGSNGEIIEAGYQHMTELKEMYYMVALPDCMKLGKNTKVQTWDDLSQCWADSQAQLTELPDDISNAFESAGLAAPVVPEGYTLWADLSDIDAGTIYRFILI